MNYMFKMTPALARQMLKISGAGFIDVCDTTRQMATFDLLDPKDYPDLAADTKLNAERLGALQEIVDFNFRCGVRVKTRSLIDPLVQAAKNAGLERAWYLGNPKALSRSRWSVDVVVGGRKGDVSKDIIAVETTDFDASGLLSHRRDLMILNLSDDPYGYELSAVGHLIAAVMEHTVILMPDYVSLDNFYRTQVAGHLTSGCSIEPPSAATSSKAGQALVSAYGVFNRLCVSQAF